MAHDKNLSTNLKLVKNGQEIHPVDVHVGQRLRQRRTILGISQVKLAHAVGVTFQQIQKYELGSNRVSASRLYELANALDAHINYFFDDMPEEINAKYNPSDIKQIGIAEEISFDGTMSRKKTLELVKYYYSITSLEIRDRVFDLVKSMALDFAKNNDKKPTD